MVGEMVSALVASVGTAAVFVFALLVRPYANEKAKNLATRQDIEAITTRIEQVRTSVQTLAQLETDYEQQRREWLLTFHDLAIEMLHNILRVDFGDFPMDSGKSLYEYQTGFRTTVASMAKAYQRVVVYFEHEAPLRIESEKTLMGVLDAEAVMRKRIGSVKIAFLRFSEAYELDRNNLADADEEVNKAKKAYSDEMEPIVETFRESLRLYITELNRFLSGDRLHEQA